MTWGTWREEGPRPAKPQLGARDPGHSVVHHVQYGVVVYWARLSTWRGGKTYPLFGISPIAVISEAKRLSALGGGDELGNFAGGEVRA